MEKRIIKTKQAPAPIGPYNQAVVSNGLVYCSGQVAIDPSNGHFINENVEVETMQVLKNLKAVLNEAGSDFSKVLKCCIFLTNMDDFTVVNEVYKKAFGEEHAPARETVEVSRLPANARVEISCIAGI
ncbi:MAG: Rid family detoxifying hydrolase [Cryomorphaceae bacterium]|nr:Rid family detoxifying hydrolase [Cryomorphaceae bacterium]